MKDFSTGRGRYWSLWESARGSQLPHAGARRATEVDTISQSRDRGRLGASRHRASALYRRGFFTLVLSDGDSVAMILERAGRIPMPLAALKNTCSQLFFRGGANLRK